MYENLDVLRLASALAAACRRAPAEIAGNVANADTPGYRAARHRRLRRTLRRRRRRFRCAPPGPAISARRANRGGLAARVDASEARSPNGNTVSLEEQMVKAAEVRQEHDMALASTPRAGDPAHRDRMRGRRWSDSRQRLAPSASGMRAQAMRLRLTSENIANADTPGYRRKTAAFAGDRRRAAADRRGRGWARCSSTSRSSKRMLRPRQPAGRPGRLSTTAPTSICWLEIADAREAKRSYEANLKMFDQARQMARAARPARDCSRDRSTQNGYPIDARRAALCPGQAAPADARRTRAGGDGRRRAFSTAGEGFRRDPAQGEETAQAAMTGRRRQRRRWSQALAADRTCGRDRGRGARQGGRGLSGNPADAGLRARWTRRSFFDTLRQGLCGR